MPRKPDDPLAPLLAEYRRTRDAGVRDEIVLSCMDLVDHIANRYRFAGEPVEDITQEGYIGLINAVEMFDPDRGVKFTTYASHAVQGAIQHYLRDKGKLIREPGWLHDLNQKINKAMGTLRQRLGREPTVAEIADELNLPDRQVADAVRSRDVFRVSSLEQPTTEDQDSSYSTIERDRAARPSDGAEVEDLPIVDRLAIEDALQQLRRVERQVVYDFFFRDLSKTEIARQLGYSSSHVSHILRRALRELKDQLLTDEREVVRRQLHSLEGQLQHFARRVEEESIKDDLTGLFNRRYIADRLDEELHRGQRYGLQLSVCLLSLENLADFRERHGDFDAERALRTVADILVGSSRRIDLIGRYDENRFILLLPQTGAQATVLCERIINLIRGHRFNTEEVADAIAIVPRFGLAVYPASGEDQDALLQSANDALLTARTTDQSIVIHGGPEAADG